MVSMLDALLKDPSIVDVAAKVLDPTASHPLPPTVVKRVSGALFDTSSTRKATIAHSFDNITGLLAAIRGNASMRVSKEGVMIRRTLLSAMLPHEFKSKTDEAQWRRLLLCRPRENLERLQLQRTLWMTGQACTPYDPGRKQWLASDKHKTWRDLMLTWLEGPEASRTTPGKYNVVTQHMNESGSIILSNHGRGRRCNPNCKPHALHWKLGSDVDLHRKFLERHPEIDSKEFTRQRFSRLSPYWLKNKPREVCACPPHKQAGCLLTGYRKAVRQLHNEGGDEKGLYSDQMKKHISHIISIKACMRHCHIATAIIKHRLTTPHTRLRLPMPHVRRWYLSKIPRRL